MPLFEDIVTAIIAGKERKTWASWDIATTFYMYKNGWKSEVSPGKLGISMWDSHIAAIQPIGPVAELFGLEIPTAWVCANQRRWAVTAALRWTIRGGFIMADYAGISESMSKHGEDTCSVKWLAWLRRGRLRIRIQSTINNGDILAYTSYCTPETEFFFAARGIMRWGWGVSVAGYKRKFQDICPEYAAMEAAARITGGRT